MVEIIGFAKDNSLHIDEYDDCFHELSDFISANELPRVQIFIVGGYACVCLGARDSLIINDCNAYIDPYISKLISGIKEIGYRHGNSEWLNNHIDSLTKVCSNAPSFSVIKPFVGKLFDWHKSYKNIDLYTANANFMLYLKLISISPSSDLKHLKDFNTLCDMRNLSIEDIFTIVSPCFRAFYPKKICPEEILNWIERARNGEIKRTLKSNIIT